MDVPIGAGVVNSIFKQIKDRNAREVGSFTGIFADYGACLQKLKELQVIMRFKKLPDHNLDPFVLYLLSYICVLHRTEKTSWRKK